ncbi:MAG: hypothetical protein R2780_11820 [Crocinitomicaceae bacterium]
MLNRTYLLLVLLNVFNVNAQNLPPLPTVDEAFNQVKNVYLKDKNSSLAVDFGISDLSQVKILKSWESEGQTIDASFSAYSSDFMYDLFPFKNPKPKDRCHIYFLLETPKESNGTYYQIPIEVVYTRLKNDALTNSWEFFWNKLGYPTELGGNEFTAEKKINLLVNSFRSMKIDKLSQQGTINNGVTTDISALMNLYTIKKIEIGYDFRKSVNEYEVNFDIEGEGYYNLLSAKSENEIQIGLRRISVATKMTKQASGWEITYMMIRGEYSGNDQLKVEENFWGHFHEVGFDAIFQTKAAYNPPYYAEFNLRNFEKDIKNAVVSLYSDSLSNANVLDQFFDENEANSKEEKKYLVDLFNNLKSKFVEIYPYSEGLLKAIVFSHKITESFEENKFGIVSLDIRLYRKSLYNDSAKQLKKMYKDGGMSEEILKQGGELDIQLKLEFSCHVVNNYLYLTKVNKAKVDECKIPF